MPSVAEPLLTAILGRVNPVNNPTLYPTGTEPLTYEIDKLPFVRDGESLPKLCVSLGEIADYEPATAEDNFAYYVYYSVTFTYIIKSNSQRKVKFVDNELKQNIVKYFLNFYENLIIPAYIPALDDVIYRRRPVYDFRKLQDGYAYMPITLDFKMQEAR